MQYEQIFIKGENRTQDVLKYKYDNNRYYITYKDGKTYPYSIRDIKIVKVDKKQIEVNAKLEYFKDIARDIGLIVRMPNGKLLNILDKNYQKINEVKKESILYNYLSEEFSSNPEPPKNKFVLFFRWLGLKKDNLKDVLIYPFGFNISQSDAIDKAISNKLSIIEGPPGTGKTQTILSIIANAIMHNENVAVVSSNNSATKNIIDKLKKYDVDFIAAYLGSNQNKQDFIETQTKIPNIVDWGLNEKALMKLYSAITNKHKKLKYMLLKQKEVSGLKLKLSALKIEQKHYLKYLEKFGNNFIPKEISTIKSSQKAIELSIILELEETVYTNWFAELIKKIIEFLRIKKFYNSIKKDLLKNYDREYLIALCQQKFYELQINDLENQIEKISNELVDYNFDNKIKEYTELSTKIFKSKLAEKYSKQNRKEWKIEELQTKSEEFIKYYPVILSTTYSLRNCLSQDVMYDYVIVDEASQVDLCTGALALSCAKKAVVVGDLKQLPNVVDSEDSKISDNIFTKYKLPLACRYKDNCLLSSITKIFPNAPHTLLREHYRCHPMIIEFCNKKFYNNELIILTENKSQRKPLVVYKTVAGNFAIGNLNQRQIDVIKKEIIPNENLCVDDDSLGIVTPYRNQTNALQAQFRGTGVKADTVDKFQGQENKVIILSTVDNIIKDFTDNPNRLNVAISRAIEQLIVVVSGNDIKNDSNIADLVKYIEYNNCEIKESKLFSIFDYLYECYAEEIEIYLKKCDKISEYKSENIFYKSLKDIINDNYQNLYGIAIRVQLNKIIRDFSLLNQSQLKYASNDWTHVDFLIYNKLTKEPTIAIEVDGASYHKIGSKQFERDQIKNEIMEKYSLPLLRFNTKDFVDEKIILEKVKEILH